MRTRACLVIGLLLVPFGAPAQDRAERGRKIVDAALTALGGPAFLAMEDRTETGRVYSFYREKLSGLAKAVVFTRHLASADGSEELAVRERTSYGATKGKKKDEEYATLFDEKGGFQITFRGARPIPDETFLRYRDTVRHNVLYILRHRLKEPGLVMEHAGTEVFENKSVERVLFIDKDNNTTEVLFQAASKLPIYQVFYRRDAKTLERSQEVTRYDKFRDAGGGAMWPMVTMRERDGQRIFQMFSDTVQINKGLTDDLFLLPSGIPTLPAAR
jgi:hypothetical protein